MLHSISAQDGVVTLWDENENVIDQDKLPKKMWAKLACMAKELGLHESEVVVKAIEGLLQETMAKKAKMAETPAE